MTAEQDELLNDVLDSIKEYVWAGFYSPDEVYDEAEEILEDEPDVHLTESELRTTIAQLFAEKREAERSWSSTTDCDRLDEAFAALDERGIAALHYAGYTQSDGLSDIAEHVGDHPGQYRGYCFYTEQDVTTARRGSMSVAFGGVEGAEIAEEIAREICLVLTNKGLKASWDGDLGHRIEIVDIVWARRSPE